MSALLQMRHKLESGEWSCWRYLLTTEYGVALSLYAPEEKRAATKEQTEAEIPAGLTYEIREA